MPRPSFSLSLWSVLSNCVHKCLFEHYSHFVKTVVKKVTGNELTTIKENSGIQGLITAIGTLDSGIDVGPTFINFGFFSMF